MNYFKCFMSRVSIFFQWMKNIYIVKWWEKPYHLLESEGMAKTVDLACTFLFLSLSQCVTLPEISDWSNALVFSSLSGLQHNSFKGTIILFSNSAASYQASHQMSSSTAVILNITQIVFHQEQHLFMWTHWKQRAYWHNRSVRKHQTSPCVSNRAFFCFVCVFL